VGGAQVLRAERAAQDRALASLRDEADDVRAQLASANGMLRKVRDGLGRRARSRLGTAPQSTHRMMPSMRGMLRQAEASSSSSLAEQRGALAKAEGELEGSKATVAQLEAKVQQAMAASEKALEHAATWQTKAGQEARGRQQVVAAKAEAEASLQATAQVRAKQPPGACCQLRAGCCRQLRVDRLAHVGTALSAPRSHLCAGTAGRHGQARQPRARARGEAAAGGGGGGGGGAGARTGAGRR
jgi:flagellar hook-basal body complex protein FliE